MSSVTCVDCGGAISTTQDELGPNGWRCRTCSLKHQIDVHSGADDQVGEISVDQMQQKASKALGLAMLAVFASLFCLGLLAAGVFSGDTRFGRRLGTYALLAIPSGLAFAGYELVAWRRARRAVAVMRSRES